MYEPFPDNYTWSLSVNLALGMGASMGEIDEIVQRLRSVETDDPETAWYSAWFELGHRLAEIAAGDAAANHALSASRKWLRACAYYFVAERHVPPSDPRKAAAYRKVLEAFDLGTSAGNHRVKRVAVPYEGTHLPALFAGVPGASGPVPCMLHLDGFDGYKEMLYLMHGYDLPRRGVSVLYLDHPGVGGALRELGLPTRYDMEVPAGAAVDYLETRPDVDPDRIGVIGISFGGYYAPRAAAFENRFSCCVAWGAIWDWHETRLRRERAGGAGLPVPAFQDQWVFGVDSWDAFYEKRQRFTLEGVADRISCPLLVVHGESDRQIPVEFAQKTVDEAANAPEKLLKLFTAVTGGVEHCMLDNVTIGTDYMFDWIADTLRA